MIAVQERVGSAGIRGVGEGARGAPSKMCTKKGRRSQKGGVKWVTQMGHPEAESDLPTIMKVVRRIELRRFE